MVPSSPSSRLQPGVSWARCTLPLPFYPCPSGVSCSSVLFSTKDRRQKESAQVPAGVSCPVGDQPSVNHARGLPAPAFSSPSTQRELCRGTGPRQMGESRRVARSVKEVTGIPSRSGKWELGGEALTQCLLASSPPKLCALDHVRLRVCSQAAVGGASSACSLALSLLPCGLGLRPKEAPNH